MPRARTNVPFPEEVTRLLEEQGWSIRRLAEEAGVDQGYLWKVLRGRQYKTASPEMARKVASAFGRPDDYFAEYREAVVRKEITADPSLRDEIFDRLQRSQSQRARGKGRRAQ